MLRGTPPPPQHPFFFFFFLSLFLHFSKKSLKIFWGGGFEPPEPPPLNMPLLDSPAVDPRSNPGLGSALLMRGKSQAVYYISSCHMLIDKALSSDKPNGHWFEADWLHCKRDALSSNRKVDGSRLTGSTQACHS